MVGNDESNANSRPVDEDEENDAEDDEELVVANEETNAICRPADDDEGNEDEEVDELRRRVEEFIEKINRGWKAEMLTTSLLVEP